VRWGIARSVVWAWILTIPASGLIAAVAYELIATIRANAYASSTIASGVAQLLGQ
jgi:hypothetical protein